MEPAPVPESLAELLRDARWLHALARTLVHDSDEAEDLLQDAWRVALARPPREAGTARVWFERVLGSLGQMRWRAQRARAARERETARGERLESAAEVVERAEAQRGLVAHVLALDEPYRSTILWRFFDGLSGADIARRAGVPGSTVRTRLARGLAELRARLERERGGAWAVALLPLVRAPAARAPLASLPWIGIAAMKTVAAAAVVVFVLLALGWWLREPAPHSTVVGAAVRADEPRAERVDAAPAIPPLADSGQRIAQSSSSGPEPAPADDELAGLVLDAAGAPVAGARVQVVVPLARQWPTFFDGLGKLEREVAAATSDDAGRFRVPVPAQRVLDLQVEAEGFAGVKQTNLYGGERLEVVLHRAAVLEGHVTRAPDGRTVVGAELEAHVGVLSNPGQARYSTRSDGEGRYRFQDLPPGFCSVSANDQGLLRRVLKEGEPVVADLELAAVTTLEGRVTDGRSELPIAGARVWLGIEEAAGVLTDAEGRYVIEGVPLADPSVELSARAPGYGVFETRVGGHSEVGGVRDLFLLPGRSARGRIVAADGEPLADAYVTAAARTVGEVDRRDARATRTDALGRFELADLRIDLRHTLLVRAEGFACAVFDFPATEWETVEIELGDLPLEAPTLVEGRVTDLEGHPLAELWVTADIEPRERDRLAPLDGGQGYLERLGSSDPMARTDARGRFRFADLPAGRWSLWAGAKGWARGGELVLTLSPGERRTDLLVAFDPLASIAGTLLDDEGRPLAGVVVNVAHAGEGRLTYDLSREDGSFALHGLEAGNYRLTTAPFGEYAYADGRWDDVATGTRDLELRLERAADQWVRVVDRVGAALPGAYVGLADEAGDVPDLRTCDRDGRVRLRVPARSSFSLGAYANRHFDPRSDFLDSFFRDESGELVPGTSVIQRALVAGPEELVLTIPGLP